MTAQADALEQKTRQLTEGGLLRPLLRLATTLQAMVLSLLMQWALQIPISYVLARHTGLGLAGVWWGFPIANLVALLVTIGWFRRSVWESRAARS